KALQTEPVPKPKIPNQYPALHLAVYFGQVKTAQLLLDKGAKVNETFRDKQTALHVAAAQGHKALVELLLEHKADINAKTSADTFGDRLLTPLQLALKGGHVEVVQLLRHTGALPKIDGTKALAAQLQQAAERKQPALVKYWLKEGAPATTKVSHDQGT